jgi:membrane protein
VKAASTLWELASETWNRFDRDNGDLLAAGISFFIVVSATPLSMIIVSVAGLAFGRTRARQALLDAVTQSSGPKLAATLSQVLDAARETTAQVAGVIAAIVALWAASRLFAQLQSALNTLWDVQASQDDGVGQRAKRFALERLVSFLMVAGCGGLLLLLLGLEAGASTLLHTLRPLLNLSTFSLALLRVVELASSVLLLTLLIAAIYRLLPDVHIPWRDVWVGAAFTATIMRLGAFVVGFVLSHFGVPGMYGALGGLAMLLLWTYQLAQIFLLGAAFTRVFSQHRQSGSA